MSLADFNLAELVADVADMVMSDLTLRKATRVFDDAVGTYTDTVVLTACRGVVTTYPAYWRANGLVEARDRQIILMAKSLGGVVPSPGDQLDDGEGLYAVVNVDSDPAHATYTLQGRR